MNRFAPLWQKVDDFFGRPQSPTPLGVFRLLIAGFALLQALLWWPDWTSFFSQDAWIQWEISRALNQAWSLHLARIYAWVEPLGLTDGQFVRIFFWVYVVCIMGLLVGWFTRVWAVLTWLCHFIIMSTIPTFVYGVDIFLQIALFYIMLMPVGKAYSLDVKQGRTSPEPSWSVTLSLRVLQIHMCLAYLSAGYEKMLAPEWWDGNVLWRSMVQPDFRQFDLTWLARYPWIPMMLSWFTMIVETFYCVAMWVPKLRIFWLLGIISLHLGIGLFLGLYLFGLVMILLSVSAFGYLAWRDWQDWRQGSTKGVDAPVLQEIE